MTREAALRAAAAAFDDGHLFDDLARRVACRTESDRGEAPPALADYLRDEIGPTLARLGFALTMVDNPVAGAGPMLIARRVESPSLPTLLAYGHGDVVSGQEAQWRDGLSPWTLVADGDRWYGRGTADNKGQHSIHLAAFEAALNARGGRLGFNVTWLFETGEEAGSPGLHAVCEAHREALAADLFLASDGPRVSASRPTLFLGSRGAVNFTLSLRSRERAYHSGNWGGVLANPATVLAHAWASMVDAHGRILVDALRPAGVPATVRRALAEVEVGRDEGDPALDAGWGEPGLSGAERLFGWNTLEVLAMEAGTPQRPINAIPPTAVLHGQLRFVVGTPWQSLAEILRAHLAAHGFDTVQVAVTMAGAATRLDLDSPWVDWAQRSIERTCGRRATLLPNLAGSLPNDVFAEGLGLPTLWLPHSYPSCAQHAPHEHLLAPVAREGLQLMAGMYWDLGEPSAPWPSRPIS